MHGRMIDIAFVERATPDQWRNELLRFRNAPLDVKRAVYRRYVSSPAWKLNRFSVLARADGACECCGKPCRPDIHHDTYERVGEERVDDMRGLCRSCHDSVHGVKSLSHAGPLTDTLIAVFGAIDRAQTRRKRGDV